MNPFYTKFCTHTHRTHCICKVCSTSTSHIWAQDKPHSIHKWGYEVCFTANVCASTHHPGSCHGTQLLPDLRYYNSLKKVPPGMLEMYLAVGDSTSCSRSSSASVQYITRDQLMWTTDCTATSTASGCFSCEDT